MAVSAGHVAGLRARSSTAIANASQGSEVKGLINIDFGQNAELLDTTHFDNGQYRQRIIGLRDATLSLSGDFIEDDAGQGILETNFFDDILAYIAYFPVHTGVSGDDGWTMAVQVQDYTLSASVEGKLEMTMTLMQAGAVTALT